MVIDRIFLWVFVTVCVLGTVGLFLQPLISFLKWDACLCPVSFSIFLSTSVCLWIPLEFLWELSFLQLFHIKNRDVVFLPFWLFVSPLSVSCSSLGLQHQPSLLALSRLFLHVTYPHFPISPLPRSVNVHAVLLSSLLLPIAVYFLTWLSHLLSFPFLSCPLCWPATAYSLSLQDCLVSNCVYSFLHFQTVYFTENVFSISVTVQSYTMFNKVR